MGTKSRKQVKRLMSGSSYSSEELSSLTMDDGTTVVYSVNGDIKRSICGRVDVHKKILMAAICITELIRLSPPFLSESSQR